MKKNRTQIGSLDYAQGEIISTKNRITGNGNWSCQSVQLRGKNRQGEDFAGEVKLLCFNYVFKVGQKIEVRNLKIFQEENNGKNYIVYDVDKWKDGELEILDERTTEAPQSSVESSSVDKTFEGALQIIDKVEQSEAPQGQFNKSIGNNEKLANDIINCYNYLKERTDANSDVLLNVAAKIVLGGK